MIFISDSWLTDLDLEIILVRFDVSDAFSHVFYIFFFLFLQILSMLLERFTNPDLLNRHKQVHITFDFALIWL